jgi:hypothetical protein
MSSDQVSSIELTEDELAERLAANSELVDRLAVGDIDALAELIAAVTGVQVRIRAAQQLLSTPLPNPLVVAALEEERQRHRTTLDQLAEL